jgi:hypothetical protein
MTGTTGPVPAARQAAGTLSRKVWRVNADITRASAFKSLGPIVSKGITMSDYLRQFASSLTNPAQPSDDGYDNSAPSSDSQVLTAVGDQSTGADGAANQTDPSKLVVSPNPSISPNGGSTDENFPQPGVEYDFCATVTNTGSLPSGPFFVLFELSPDMDWSMTHL